MGPDQLGCIAVIKHILDNRAKEFAELVAMDALIECCAGLVVHKKTVVVVCMLAKPIRRQTAAHSQS